MEQSQQLAAYLQRLEPTGLDGLEGLIARLLERLTGQRFFLAHSGSQDGRDMSTAGFGNTWIAVETKRFRSPNSFRQRDLLGELLELPEGVDLWVLASTVRVSDQIIAKLRREGAKRGIEVETLDAPPGQLGDLPVLCAAYEDVSLAFLGESAATGEISHLFEAIRRHPEFPSTLENLRARFSDGSIGYAQARAASLDFLRSVFEDSLRARVELGQPINVLQDGGRHVVERRQALAALDSWWSRWSAAPRPFILLGEEGMGKTWALASWLARGLVGSESELPITLFVPASAAGPAKALDLLASALAICGGVRDPQFWPRRAEAFANRPRSTRPALLVIIDGLNEQPNSEWARLIESFALSPWDKQVAVVMTCRPAYWREEVLSELQSSLPSFEVGPYEDDELASAANKSNLDISKLPSTLGPLLRRPRYFALTVRHREALEESGDITVDRLLYEDWKDRLRHKRGLFSDEDFRGLLIRLAARQRNQLQGGLLKREIQDLLPPGDNHLTGLSEIITGGIFARRSDGHYSVEPRRLIQGLGLLLADEVRSVSDQARPPCERRWPRSWNLTPTPIVRWRFAALR